MRTYNASAERMNNGEIQKFNKKYGHLATSNRDEYVRKYRELDNRIFNEEAKKTEKLYNTPRKSTRELNRLADYRYKGESEDRIKTKDSNPYREKAKSQIKSAGGLLAGTVMSNILGSVGDNLVFNGEEAVGSVLSSGSKLASVGLGAAAVVQSARAGYNYMKSKSHA